MFADNSFTNCNLFMKFTKILSHKFPAIHFRLANLDKINYIRIHMNIILGINEAGVWHAVLLQSTVLRQSFLVSAFPEKTECH